MHRILAILVLKLSDFGLLRHYFLSGVFNLYPAAELKTARINIDSCLVAFTSSLLVKVIRQTLISS